MEMPIEATELKKEGALYSFTYKDETKKKERARSREHPCRVSGSSPTQRTKTLEAKSCGQKRKKKKLVSPISQFKLDGVMKHSLALTSLSERSIPFPNT